MAVTETIGSLQDTPHAATLHSNYRVAHNEHLLGEVVIDVGGLQSKRGGGIDPSFVSRGLLCLFTHCQQVCRYTHTHTHTQWNHSLQTPSNEDTSLIRTLSQRVSVTNVTLCAPHKWCKSEMTTADTQPGQSEEVAVLSSYRFAGFAATFTRNTPTQYMHIRDRRCILQP